jgi:hypothetical protein
MLGRACASGGCVCGCGQWCCMQQGAAVLRSLSLAAPAGPLAERCCPEHAAAFAAAALFTSPACSAEHSSSPTLSITAAAASVILLGSSQQRGSRSTTGEQARSSRHACMLSTLAGEPAGVGECKRWRQRRAGALAGWQAVMWPAELRS